MSASPALASVRCVRVGTRNEPKLAAVRAAMEAYVPAVRVEGTDVESGVPEQPVGFAEIVRGARNRAAAALATGPCELAVGIEDGLVVLDEVPAPEGGCEVLNVGAAVVRDGERESLGLSSGFAYPPACVEPALAERADIGSVFDRTWLAYRSEAPAELPSARTSGNVGKLSDGVLPRAEYARHAVLCALVRFLHPGLYPAAAPVPS